MKNNNLPDWDIGIDVAQDLIDVNIRRAKLRFDSTVYADAAVYLEKVLSATTKLQNVVRHLIQDIEETENAKAKRNAE